MQSGDGHQCPPLHFADLLVRQCAFLSPIHWCLTEHLRPTPQILRLVQIFRGWAGFFRPQQGALCSPGQRVHLRLHLGESLHQHDIMNVGARFFCTFAFSPLYLTKVGLLVFFSRGHFCTARAADGELGHKRAIIWNRETRWHCQNSCAAGNKKRAVVKKDDVQARLQIKWAALKPSCDALLGPKWKLAAAYFESGGGARFELHVWGLSTRASMMRLFCDRHAFPLWSGEGGGVRRWRYLICTTVASDAWDDCTNDVFFRWVGKEEVRVDKWAMVLRGKNVDLGRRQSPRLFECKYEDLRRGKGAYVTAAEWTRAMRHQRSTFHHFVPILPPLSLSLRLGIILVWPAEVIFVATIAAPSSVLAGLWKFVRIEIENVSVKSKSIIQSVSGSKSKMKIAWD